MRAIVTAGSVVLLFGTPLWAQTAPGEISLSPNWKQPENRDTSAQELGQLLAKTCQAQIRLKPAETPVFLREVKLLMPAMHVAQSFNKTPGLRRAVNCPAFPRSSFFAHSLDVELGDYTQVLLITDTANRLIGLQLTHDNPKQAVEYFSTDQKPPWTTYDFIQQLARGNKTWLVRAMVQRSSEVNVDRIGQGAWQDFSRTRTVPGDGWLIQIDTELLRPEIASTGYRSYRSTYRYEVQKRVRLYLPQVVGDLVLSRIEYQLR